MAFSHIGTGGDTMKWFTDLKKGQKVLILINAVLAIALLVLAFSFLEKCRYCKKRIRK